MAAGVVEGGSWSALAALLDALCAETLLVLMICFSHSALLCMQPHSAQHFTSKFSSALHATTLPLARQAGGPAAASLIAARIQPTVSVAWRSATSLYRRRLPSFSLNGASQGSLRSVAGTHRDSYWLEASRSSCSSLLAPPRAARCGKDNPKRRAAANTSSPVMLLASTLPPRIERAASTSALMA